jgi:sugar phosphate isomerase/epimerase
VTTPDFGIFARVFPKGPARAVADSIAAAGYSLAQLNLRALGFRTIPSSDEWRAIEPAAVRAEFAASGVSCWGLSCSYNMAHPDPALRRAGTIAAMELIGRASAFGATAVTLCTGSRDAERMWAYHPDNGSEAAWRDMRAELDLLLEAARGAGVVLAVEPERGNVVSNADAALRLYSELGGDSTSVGIIADSANLLSGLSPETHRDVLDHSFASLADRIICLHAKDLVPWADTLDDHAVIDYEHVAALYARLDLRAPVIVQDVSPAQAAAALTFLRARFNA